MKTETEKIETQIRTLLEQLYYNDTDIYGNVSCCCHEDEVDQFRNANSSAFVDEWKSLYDNIVDENAKFNEDFVSMDEYIQDCKDKHDEAFMVRFDDDFEFQYLKSSLGEPTEMAAPIAEKILALYEKYEDAEFDEI